MTHRVNAAVLRIGKSLNWHSLGSPMYRWRDLKINLFLNYFLARFLEKESYRMVRYGVRSENNFFKIVIVAFRITTIVGTSKGTKKPPFETYWTGYNIFKHRFRLGVFKYRIQGAEERMTPPLIDAVGTIYVNKIKKIFSINPVRNWDKTFIFLTDGIHLAESDPRDVNYVGTVGLSTRYYVRMAAKFMILRYVIKKSVMRLLKKKIMPPHLRIFLRNTLFFNLVKFENFFIGRSKNDKDRKNFLFSFLMFKIKNRKKLKKHRLMFSKKVGKMLVGKISTAKTVRSKRKLCKKNFLKLKRRYFVLKKNYALWWKRAKKIVSSRRKKSFRRGFFNLKRFFSRLRFKKKIFKTKLVYSLVRGNKNRLVKRYLNYKKIFFFERKSKDISARQ